MTTCAFAKSDTAKFILRSKKGTPKVALPSLPVYIVVHPPPPPETTAKRTTGDNQIRIIT